MIYGLDPFVVVRKLSDILFEVKSQVNGKIRIYSMTDLNPILAVICQTGSPDYSRN